MGLFDNIKNIFVIPEEDEFEDEMETVEEKAASKFITVSIEPYHNCF